MCLAPDEVAPEREIVLEIVDAIEFATSVLNHEVIKIVHSGAVAVVKDIVNIGRIACEHVLTEGEIGFLIVEQREHSGRDIGLLHKPCGVALDGQLSAGGVEEDGDKETPHVIIVVLAVAHTGVVGSENEDGIIEPGLVLDLVEVAANGVVGIANGLVHGNFAAGESILVLLGNGERLVTRRGEDGEEERLAPARNAI